MPIHNNPNCTCRYRCDKHPRYRAIKKPRSYCEECWKLWLGWYPMAKELRKLKGEPMFDDIIAETLCKYRGSWVDQVMQNRLMFGKLKKGGYKVETLRNKHKS